MRKRLTAVLAAVALCIGLTAVGVWYCVFVSRTIYKESTEHLREIYHQANQSLYSLVGRNWSAMHMWTPFLSSGASDREIEAFAAQARQEHGFTDFYFISREGSYRTVDGGSGYLDMREQLPALILEHKDVVVNAVVPGQPQIMVFAVPADPGTYRGFAYDAIAISFNNEDLLETLKISAFNGQSISYVVRSDGRVVVDGSDAQSRKTYNVLALLRDQSDLSQEAIETISADFRGGKSGAAAFKVGNKRYYLVYESANFEDWIVLGIVPTAVVNASMSRLQTTTLILVTVIAFGIVVTILSYVIRRNRQNLRRKDTQLVYRDALFSTLSRNVNDVFMMLDAKNLRVDYLSPNVEKLLGVPEEEARDDIRTLDALAKNREIPLIFDQLLAIQPGQQVDWDREYIHRKTGEDRWFHGTALCRVLYGRKKYILVLSDRTKEKRTNRALEDAVRAAQSASRAKGAVPSILSSGNHKLDMSGIESGTIRIEEQQSNLAEAFHGRKGSNQTDAGMDMMPPPSEKGGHFRGKRLLLAEDNDRHRETAQELLEEYGFVLDTANNGAAAVRKVSAAAPGTYDLVLMDIQMPVMDGFEATRRIRALPEPALSRVPIIAMTDNVFDEDRRAAARCGMNGFVSKPIDMEELVKTLYEILG